MPQKKNNLPKAPVSIINPTVVDVILPSTNAIMRCGKCHHFDWGVFVKPHLATAKIHEVKCKHCGHTLKVDDGVPIGKDYQSWKTD